MALNECYIDAGGDYEDVMRRFMREERVARFLKMFLNDGSFAQLCTDMENSDYESAFRMVHTMKGICMNLSFSALLDSCIKLAENLRGGQPDADTEACFNETKENYLRTTAAIKSYLE